METFQYFFMISTIMNLFGLIAAGINRRWWWMLGFVAGAIVSLTAAVAYS